MVDYNQITVIGEESNKKVALTSQEQKLKDAEVKAWNDASATRKLTQLKQMRLERLQETDYYALQDVTISDAMKTYRQNLRDIPANYTDEAAYDLLLARDENGNLTHSVWSKP
jgi:hypothetical protein